VQFSAQYHENEANADEAECNSEPRSISLHQVSVGAFRNLTLSFAPPFEQSAIQVIGARKQW
jgi:hypothetical protein